MKVPGTYVIAYEKNDGYNTGSKNRSVTVVDTTAPLLTLSGSSNMTVEASTGSFLDAGALWTDIVDGTGTLTLASTGTVNMRVPGLYTLTYTKTDAHGNISNTVSRSVTVIDTTAPILTFSGSSASMTVEASS
jgi:Domain of unknown function (DUF5011)